jgi:iron(III) transport system substrate-binding protein
MMKNIRRFLIPVVILVVVSAMAYRRMHPGPVSLTVYCSHDAVYSESVLRRFERETGIPVRIKFDTEATKSLGLIEQLIREKDAPRCDVFWNNELLGTMDLHERGLLEPYKGPGHARIPAAFKDADGYWTGFGARLRVWIVNTNNVDAAGLEDALRGSLERVTVAKPLYGTTLTHYSLLWHLWGGDKLQQWHRDWRARGVKEADGNGKTKNLVAAGVCDFGWTDTDDFFVAKDERKPVTMKPVTLENGSTVCIPNTVSIVKGSRNIEGARKLVDYLLSAESELALANSAARQVPLGPVDEAQLHDDVRALIPWAAKGADLSGVGAARAECLAWLKREYGLK